MVEEEVTTEEPGAEEAVAAEAMIEVAAAEVVVEEEATAKVAETLDAEVAAAEETAADISDDSVPVAALVEVPSAASAEPTSAVTVPIEPLPSAPHRPRGIMFRSVSVLSLLLSMVAVSLPSAPLSQDSTVVTELAVVGAIDTDAPSLPPASSTVLTELVVADALGAPSAAETTPFDDLEELYASLHEEGSSSASAPLDEDSRAVTEKLREFLFFGVHQMTTVEAFLEFKSCLDMAMAMGLLDSA
ncbi:unnamed protein product [Prunus brigantina]